jgi:steroid delta-isomerase-like uncharacterized protein
MAGLAEAIARDYTDAWNRRDWDAYKNLMAPGYSYTGGDGQRAEGPEAGLGVGQMFATAFPDGRINVDQIHVCGDTAIVEFTGTGTHNGELAGIPPSGRKVSILVVDILDTRDGKIIAEREFIDMMALMQQIGAVPAGATA